MIAQHHQNESPSYYEIAKHVDPDSSCSRVEHAWQRLKEELHARRPYLAIVQQFFTYPRAEIEPLIIEFYRIIPDAYTYLAPFRRPKPALMVE